MADGVQPQVIGNFEPLLLNKFFDPSTPSMRKGDEGGEEKNGKKERQAWAELCQAQGKLSLVVVCFDWICIFVLHM